MGGLEEQTAGACKPAGSSGGQRQQRVSGAGRQRWLRRLTRSQPPIEPTVTSKHLARAPGSCDGLPANGRGGRPQARGALGGPAATSNTRRWYIIWKGPRLLGRVRAGRRLDSSPARPAPGHRSRAQTRPHLRATKTRLQAQLRASCGNPPPAPSMLSTPCAAACRPIFSTRGAPIPHPQAS